jgi:uncharacterized membrane protein
MASREELNDREWADPENWGGPSWCSLYFSKRDSRVLVPKRRPWAGWTFNLARTAGALWFTGLLLFAILVPIVVLLLATPVCR